MGDSVMGNDAAGAQNSASGADPSEGERGAGAVGGPLNPDDAINGENGVEPVAPEDTGAATGADEDPDYASVRPTGGSIDRDTGA